MTPFELIEPTTLKEAIAAIDPDLPIYDVQTLDRRISDSMVGLGYVAVMMAVLGVIALVLACVGVYGVMSFSVAERTHEIGIRMALGAQRGEVLRLVLRHGLLLAGIALGIGLPVSLGLSRLLARLVFGVSATDPATFAGVSALLLLVAIAACYFPARRAASLRRAWRDLHARVSRPSCTTSCHTPGISHASPVYPLK